MDVEQLRYIRKRWLWSIFEFANIDFQKRLWIDAVFPDIISDSNEAICRYFNDLNLEEGYDYFLNEKVVSTTEYQIVKDFHNQLDTYIDRPDKKTLSDKNMLKDPEWIQLCAFANSVWQKLKKEIAEKDELEYMERLEKEYLTGNR